MASAKPVASASGTLSVGSDSAKPGPSGINSTSMKEKSVRIIDDGYSSKELLDALVLDIGVESIVGCVKVGGQWVVNVKECRDADLLMETGLVIGGRPFSVYGITRNITTVSLFGVPSFISDAELNSKLMDYGCKIKSSWTHKTFPEYPNIENGIRFVRLELPDTKKSLPYAIIINGVHLRVKHNGQVKVCNLCLAEDHIMKNCPSYKCKECGTQGHSESQCPSVLCYACKKHGHKSFSCPDRSQSHNQDGSMDTDHTYAKTIDPTPDVDSGKSGANSKVTDQIVESAAPMESEDLNVNLPAGTINDSPAATTSKADHTAKRNLSCDENDEENECSPGSENASQNCITASRQKKHITPDLLSARKLSPLNSADHGNASSTGT
ncbi:hypothetical protein HOLleu_30777 [Holothuria leucospilota]|uniref:CCHC-type domain-containing protein n=1 Tax=Holothuria leucospilota TaxID=206669 RepID=A0A9Q1BKT6_HOLLE|nr:hypothetical protein HOLleu_30777 [Holothuria leucospilota]